MNVAEFGKLLILLGIFLVVIGGLIGFTPLGLGRLPGDILVKRGNFTFYFPMATSIMVSILLSLMFCLLGKKTVTNYWTNS